MKKIKLLSSLVAFSFIFTSSLSCSSRLNGANAFMFKMTGNHFGESLYSGFKNVMEQNGKKYVDKSPSEANVGAQVQMIETLMMQNVHSIVISASGTTGYDQILKRATEKGIKIVSTDSPVSPAYRSLHVNHCDEKEVGIWLARAAVLIACGENYKDPESYSDWKPEKLLEQPVKDALSKRKETDRKIVFGIVSSTQDSPSQNKWIDWIKKELQNKAGSNINYAEKNIDIDPHVEYGDDETKKSKDKADYFIQQKVDVIIAPTSVAMSACATEIHDTMEKDPSCKVKLTGLGMPSECASQMPDPTKPDKKDMDYICPYMMLWNVIELGQCAAAVTLKALEGNNWKIGDEITFTTPAPHGSTHTHKIFADTDGGPTINALQPFPFTRYNIADWKDIL